jgi:hypothetical protein
MLPDLQNRALCVPTWRSLEDTDFESETYLGSSNRKRKRVKLAGQVDFRAQLSEEQARPRDRNYVGPFEPTHRNVLMRLRVRVTGQ